MEEQEEVLKRAGSIPDGELPDFDFLRQDIVVQAGEDDVRQTSVVERPELSVSGSPRATRSHRWLSAYATGITVLFFVLLLSGRISLFPQHPLESLPDVRPLDSNEFQIIPEGAELPEGHQLQLGESRRFGDVLVTPVKVTLEPLKFIGFLSGAEEAGRATLPVLKLWLEFRSAASDYSFPPFDAALHSARSPVHGTDESVLANSFLRLSGPAGEIRVLNYLQSPDSNFLIAGQNSGLILRPQEVMTTFVASDETLDEQLAQFPDSLTWRVQFRKGVHVPTAHGVTTLIDVSFRREDIQKHPAETL